MKTIKIGIILIFIVGMTQTVSSQFFKELKKEIAESAKKAVKRKAKKETEKKVDAAMDSVLNPTLPKRRRKQDNPESSNKESDEEANPDFSDLLKTGNCESSYDYNLQTTMQIINHGRKSSDTNYIQMAHGEISSLTSMSRQKMLIITDWKNESSVMINTKKLSYSVISLNAMSGILKSKEAKKELEAGSNLKFEKTGKTKIICKYNCSQYIAKDGNTKHEVWATKEIDFDDKKLTKVMGNVTKQNFNAIPEGKGYLMEMTTYKKEKIDSQMRITNVNKNPFTIDLNNYKKN